MLPKPRLTLLAAAVLAANLAHAIQAASAPFTPEQQQLIRQISASEANGLLPQVASAAAANVQKTIEGEKQAIAVAKDALEVGRKSVDWWLSNISLWVGGLGLLITVAGIGIPLWIVRKQKAELANITEKLNQAEQYVYEIEKLRDSALKKTSLIPNAAQLTGKLSKELLEKLRKEKPPQVVGLIEQAWEAHEKKDWARAKPLWELLSLIESHDSIVWFNLGFVESELEDDWERAHDYFRRSYLLNPTAAACHNMANSLYQWAWALTGDDRKKRLAEADQYYSQATRLQQNFDIAFRNWSIALDLLANTLVNEERKAILSKNEIVQKLAADSQNPYHLACLRAHQQSFDEARTLLKQARATGLLPTYAQLSSDKHLNSLRELDWFKALLAEVKQEEERQAAAV